MSDYQGNIIIKNPATPTGPVQTGSAPGMWRMDEVSYWLKQGVWPTQGVTGADPYFPYVTLLLSTTALGNASNNLFVDSSGAFNPISRNGNTTQGSVTPYSANWSNYFDGSSTLTFSTISLTGDFTIEAWVYYTSTSGNPTLLGANPPNDQSLRRLSGKHYFYRQGASITGTIDIPSNQWVHLAATRSGSTVRIFTNGVLDGSASISGTFSLFCLGGVDTSTDRLTGYASNVRVVNGTALYTATFTPPTQPLTAVSGTVLLTCQSNRFRDASASPYTLTVNGSPRVTDFAPFSSGSSITYNQSDITNWSGYFDGSGDYLTIPSNAAFAYGTGDFTWEMWVFPTAASWTTNNYYLMDHGSNGGTLSYYQNVVRYYNPTTGIGSALYTNGGSIPANQWTHVAVSRSGGTTSLFVNGALRASASDGYNYGTAAVTIANYGGGGVEFQGYISNTRIVKGTAVYTGAFTPPTTNLTAISGTSLLTLQNAAFTDNSANSFPITIAGNTTVTGNSPFNTVGYWSNYFDGNGDYLSFSGTSALNQSGDFTIEAWIYLTATPSAATPIYAFETNNFMKFGINTSRNLVVDQSNVGIKVTGSTALNLNTWYHMAFVRSGSASNNCKIYLNGVQEGQFTDTSSVTVSGTGRICSRTDLTSGFLTCYLSNLRVTNTAVYTSAFTPSTTPLTAISGTQLLTCQSGRFIDSSANAIGLTSNGDVSVQSFDPFYTATIASNGGSMYFDGSGDELGFPISPVFTLGSSDFTIEGWLYPTSLPENSTAFVLDSSTYPRVMWIYTSGAFHVYASSSGSSWEIDQIPAVVVGQWNHLVFQRNGNSFRTFLNGVLVATTTSALTFPAQRSVGYIGRGDNTVQRWNGYISNFRITTGSAIYSTSGFTPPTAPVTPTANTTLLVNGMNAGIYDATAINDMETVGNAQVSTVQSKFGGSSMYFDGSGDYLSIRSVPELAFGTGDFTIEAWVYITANSGDWFIISSIGSGGLFFGQRAGSGWGYGRTAVAWDYNSGVNPVTNTWQHLAISRSGTSIRMFVDGTQIGTTQSSATDYSLAIGGTAVGSQGAIYYMAGYLDDLRVTKGYARYTANFTPPTQAFPTY